MYIWGFYSGTSNFLSSCGWQVKVAFHSSLSLLAYLRQSAEEVPPNVSLVTNESGERKLRFRQTLSVHYNNNSLQTVPLCAHLSLPTVSLSCDSLDFGTCYVGQTLVKEVHLSNRGGSSSYWRVLIGNHGSIVTRALIGNHGTVDTRALIVNHGPAVTRALIGNHGTVDTRALIGNHAPLATGELS
uniref:Uncharacterized protein n=1 Tax=Hucho hucho TaxID=62062 RepID=A0A4W5KKM8_9TELE